MGKQEQRVDPDRYQVVPRTLIFLLSESNEVLMIKGSSKKKIWANLYNGIGGHIERGEDVLTAARREILEETGLSGGELRLHGVIMIDVHEKTGICLYVFSGKKFMGEIKESEEGEIHWVDPANLPEGEMVSDIRIILPKVLEESGQMFFAKYYYQDNLLKIEFVD